jgi:hypothetical protein
MAMMHLWVGDDDRLHARGFLWTHVWERSDVAEFDVADHWTLAKYSRDRYVRANLVKRGRVVPLFVTARSYPAPRYWSGPVEDPDARTETDDFCADLEAWRKGTL